MKKTNFSPLLSVLKHTTSAENILTNYYQLNPQQAKLKEDNLANILTSEAENLGLTQETAPFLKNPQKAAHSWKTPEAPKGIIRKAFEYVKH